MGRAYDRARPAITAPRAPRGRGSLLDEHRVDEGFGDEAAVGIEAVVGEILAELEVEVRRALAVLLHAEHDPPLELLGAYGGEGEVRLGPRHRLLVEQDRDVGL